MVRDTRRDLLGRDRDESETLRFCPSRDRDETLVHVSRRLDRDHISVILLNSPQTFSQAAQADLMAQQRVIQANNT